MNLGWMPIAGFWGAAVLVLALWRPTADEVAGASFGVLGVLAVWGPAIAWHLVSSEWDDAVRKGKQPAEPPFGWAMALVAVLGLAVLLLAARSIAPRTDFDACMDHCEAAQRTEGEGEKMLPMGCVVICRGRP